MGQPGRRQAGCGLGVEHGLEQRRKFARPRAGATALVGAGAGATAHAIGVGALVEGVQRAQPLAASPVDQVNVAEVPARVTDPGLAQVAPRLRHLVADAFDRDGAVGSV